MMALAQKRSWWSWKWPHVLLLVAMVLIIVDRTRPVQQHMAVVKESEEFRSRYSSRGTHYFEYWSVVDLSSGETFQTKRAVGNFPIGSELEVRTTKLFGNVIGYRSTSPGGGGWYELEWDNEDFRPFPYVIGLAALALLLPWRSQETRWLITGVLGVCITAWLFCIGSTNVFRLFSW